MRSRREWSLALAVLFVVAISSVIYMFASAPQSGPNTVSFVPLPHKPIEIGEDRDFTLAGAGSGCECVRSGDGSEGNPYLIAGWVINGSGVDGISIRGTKTNFLVKGVKITGTGLDSGLRLVSVENGGIEDSWITNESDGVYVFQSTKLVFRNNTIAANNIGIRLEAADNNILLSNHFDGNTEVAIFIRGSGNLIKDNVVTNSKFGGINIDGTIGTADGNIVEHNTVTGGASYGIAAWRATNNILRNNTVSGNGVGILLTEISNINRVEGNIVTENRGDGILITEESAGNSVIQNTVKGNGDGVNSFDLHALSFDNTWESNSYNTKNPDTLS